MSFWFSTNPNPKPISNVARNTSLALCAHNFREVKGTKGCIKFNANSD